MIYVIPAREGSKGYKYKNRILFKYTAELIKDKKVIVTTDDSYIIATAKKYNFVVLKRNKKLSSGKADIKSVMKDVINRFKINDNICMLYLTYPHRKINDLNNAIKYYTQKKADSLLCLQPIKTHPYLVMQKNKTKWIQMIKHDLYRRQDYPVCMELSHYICIFNSGNIDKLNNQLYNNDTAFFKLDERVKDIDYESDFI